MAGSSIFVTYGLKSGGGAPFLRRTRNAFGQLQSRTRTGATSSQRQTRTRTCSCSTSTSRVWNATAFIGCGATPYDYCFTSCPSTSSFSYCKEDFIPACGGEGIYDARCENVTSSSCNWGGYSGWSNVSSCTTSSPGCTNGALQRQCQTVSVCGFGAWTAFSNVASCSAASPGCSNGALQRECQTAFSFREQDWSAFEEADECITSSPTPADGAVAVECIAN